MTYLTQTNIDGGPTPVWGAVASGPPEDMRRALYGHLCNLTCGTIALCLTHALRSCQMAISHSAATHVRVDLCASCLQCLPLTRPEELLLGKKILSGEVVQVGKHLREPIIAHTEPLSERLPN